MAERKLETRSGEIPFSSKMSAAFFDLGYAPVGGGQHIEDVEAMFEEPTGLSRILVNIRKTNRYGEARDLGIATAVFRELEEAERLAASMNLDTNLSRANRAIEAVPAPLANIGNQSLAGSAVPALAVAATTQIAHLLS